MKKNIVTLAFLLSGISGFAQVSKADMEAFLGRNPVSGFARIEISTEVFRQTLGPKISLSEKALFLTYTDSGGRPQERVFPYDEISMIRTFSEDETTRILQFKLKH